MPYSNGRKCSLGQNVNVSNNVKIGNGYRRTLIKHDATLGANCTIVCGHTIGEFATVAAGTIITEDVKPHALMVGVPARQIGWVCECGQVLGKELVCGDCKKEYKMD